MLSFYLLGTLITAAFDGKHTFSLYSYCGLSITTDINISVCPSIVGGIELFHLLFTATKQNFEFKKM